MSQSVSCSAATARGMSPVRRAGRWPSRIRSSANLEFDVVIAWSRAPVWVTARPSPRRKDGWRQRVREARGRLRIETSGVVEKVLGDPSHAAAEDGQGVMRLCDGEAAFAEDGR